MGNIPGCIPRHLRSLKIAFNSDMNLRRKENRLYKRIAKQWAIEIGLSLGWFRKPSPASMPDVFTKPMLRAMGLKLPAEFYSVGGSILQDAECIEAISDDEIEAVVFKNLQDAKNMKISSLPVISNIKRLGYLYDMTDAEQAILFFFFIFTREGNVLASMPQLQDMSTPLLCQIIAMLAGHDYKEIEKSMHEESLLNNAHLAWIKEGFRDLSARMQVGEIIEDVLQIPNASDDLLLYSLVERVSPATLPISAFEYMQQDIDILAPYLANSIRLSERGVNVLFYGPPGTGKTELAKVLAESIGAILYSPVSEDRDAGTLMGEDLINDYCRCQKFIKNRKNALLLLDDIDDIFDVLWHKNSYEDNDSECLDVDNTKSHSLRRCWEKIVRLQYGLSMNKGGCTLLYQVALIMLSIFLRYPAYGRSILHATT